MKKSVTILLAAVLSAALLCGCTVTITIPDPTPVPSPETGTDSCLETPESTPSPVPEQEAMNAYQEGLGLPLQHLEDIESLQVTTMTEDGCQDFDYTDKAYQAAQMLSELRIIGPTNEDVTDQDVIYTFTLKNGEKLIYAFNGGHYRLSGTQAPYGDVTYEIENYRTPSRIFSSGSDSAAVEEITSPDPDEVQYAYNKILDRLTEESSSEFNHGSIQDYFDRGFADMVLAYTPDGNTIYAGIYTWDDGSVVEKTIPVAPMAGGARLEIYAGTYGDPAVPVYYLLYSNYDGDIPFGTVTAYSCEDGTITELYCQEYEGKDQWRNTIAENEDIDFGQFACAFSSEKDSGTELPLLRVS